MTDAATRSINLSLISHTNAGKTTLARTLLRRDVGEVRDAPHVTDLSEAYVMLETADGHALRLWDTPGFGDTARLIKRLKLSGNPLGWILTQVWDRYTDRPFWCSQQAIRNVKEDADIVLYLVNAAEDPVDAAYVDMEMQILGWIGKPVILLLNQKGPPRPHSEEAAEEEKWRRHLHGYGWVRSVLSLDAFARCWVQESILLATVEGLLPADRQAAFRRLRNAWRDKNLDIFYRSMGVLADQLAAAAGDAEALEKKSLGDKARAWLRSLGMGTGSPSDKERAMAALAERLDGEIRTATDRMIALHALQGHAASEVLQRLADDYASTEPVNEGYAALVGGFASGALSGLAADIASGGLTFGAAALGGGILGALGAGSIARGYNLVLGQEASSLRWSAEFFLGLVRSALLRYLAVAHFGRGRGEYTQGEHPTFWQQDVTAIVEARRGRIISVWESAKVGGERAELVAPLESVLGESAAALLKRLYPDASELAFNPRS